MRTTTWPQAAAASRVGRDPRVIVRTRSPSACGSAPLPARRRANSPTCGVRTAAGGRLPPGVDRGQRAQRLGVEDDRRAVVAGPIDEPADELGRREARAQARSHDERVVLVIEDPGEGRLRVDLLDVVLGQGHRRRLDDLGREQRLQRLGHGQRHEADPGATGRPADEQRRARVVERPGDHEQLAERALVAAHRPLGQERRHRRIVEPRGALRPRANVPGHVPDRPVVDAAPAEPDGPLSATALGPSILVGQWRVRASPAAPPACGLGPHPLHARQDPTLAVVEPVLDVGGKT